MATNGMNGTSSETQITFYSNDFCPSAQRIQIVLETLGLPYDTSIIDLNRPRDPWYLEINPRGRVPCMKYSSGSVKNAVITESTIITRFLCDLQPSHLMPIGDEPEALLKRARINHFIFAWETNITPLIAPTLLAEDREREAKAQVWSVTMEREIEPLLEDAAPFVGASENFTLAEVTAAPFLALLDGYNRHGLFPLSVKSSLDTLPNFAKWANAVQQEKINTKNFDVEAIVNATKIQIPIMKSVVAKQK